MTFRILSFILGLLGIFLAAKVEAMEPPRTNAEFPDTALGERLRHFTTKRGFIKLTKTVVANRVALFSGQISVEQASAQGGTIIKGKRSIPVIMLKYKDSGADPYPVSNLQKELFDGPWPSGTMTDFYKQISYGQFSVTGIVLPWFTTVHNSSFYEGAIQTVIKDGKPVKVPCNGLCQSAQLGALLTESLDAAGKTINFAEYDDDGPDGMPNTADDDGYVDFVAFVHPGKGGECGSSNSEINNNIWSHRFRLSDLMGKDYETNAVTKSGRHIRIDDYVIMPALDCDGSSMIEIGVFCHEFGHAFGLPDLYDTSHPAKSQGVGNWDLMGAGSWGGDDRSPHRPAHMAAWSKAFLGWVKPEDIKVDTPNATLRLVENFPDVLRVDVSHDVYYLLEYRGKTGFDDSITGPGLMVWRVNDPVVQIGLLNNSVNNDPNNEGVALIQADGLRQLEDIRLNNRGDAGDPFPGSANKTTLDNTGTPSTNGSIALCNISMTPERVTLNIRVSNGVCGSH